MNASSSQPLQPDEGVDALCVRVFSSMFMNCVSLRQQIRDTLDHKRDAALEFFDRDLSIAYTQRFSASIVFRSLDDTSKVSATTNNNIVLVTSKESIFRGLLRFTAFPLAFHKLKQVDNSGVAMAGSAGSRNLGPDR